MRTKHLRHLSAIEDEAILVLIIQREILKHMTSSLNRQTHRQKTCLNVDEIQVVSLNILIRFLISKSPYQLLIKSFPVLIRFIGTVFNRNIFS